jgi:LysM repeat protein
MPYTVRSGDTLSRIARKHRVAISKLLEANPRFKPNPNRIRVGDIVNIPGESTPGTPPRPAPQPKLKLEPQPQPRADRVLGRLSMQYETGGRGGATVSSGAGDAGGASYGSYQMTSKPKGGTVGRFVADAAFPFPDRFDGLAPGTAEFTAAWKALAASRPEDFEAAQHDYIKRTHFDPLVRKLIDEDGLNVLTRSAALQDVIWSTAVQHGGATSIPHEALARVNLDPADAGFDEAFITAIYAERGRKRSDGTLAYFPRASAQVQAGVAKRFRNELEDALGMLGTEG